MNSSELLAWFGDILNFIVLIYLIFSVVGTNCFNIEQFIIASVALLVSVLIHLYISVSSIRK